MNPVKKMWVTSREILQLGRGCPRRRAGRRRCSGCASAGGAAATRQADDLPIPLGLQLFDELGADDAGGAHDQGGLVLCGHDDVSFHVGGVDG